MRRISSRTTFFNKRIFPAIWIGFLILMAGLPFVFGQNRSAPPLSFVVMPAIMAVVGIFIMRKLVFDLVDEVWDDGDALLVKNRSEEERIPLSDIKNVSYSPYMNPPRVTLSLRQPSRFGEQVTFAAPIRLVPFATSPVINELIERVDAARQRHA
jgi:hypothetical protein